MYGNISAKLVIDYAEETNIADITTDDVTFKFADAIKACDNAALLG